MIKPVKLNEKVIERLANEISKPADVPVLTGVKFEKLGRKFQPLPAS